MDISKAIRVAMAQRNMNARQLAEIMGVNAPALRRVIREGSPTVASLKGIADGLGMKVSELVALGE